MVLPYVDTTTDGLLRYQEYGPSQFKPSSILGSFLGDPPIIPKVSPDAIGAPVCMMSTSRTEVSQDTDSRSNDTEASAMAASLAYATSQAPFLYPPSWLHLPAGFGNTGVTQHIVGTPNLVPFSLFRNKSHQCYYHRVKAP